ncbi:hypothetical protein M569_01316 [Genlisea aurea]|uniref:Uncharacterized protein n=1 Tax=Genlisea aurea TaxID=192259 RepID=S8D113_9LAMI|nr:hypothetical protein M569_01316 [Genlisea aurea]
MYVTRARSLYRRFSGSPPPADTLYSGNLIVSDRESSSSCCFGIDRSRRVETLPFPSDEVMQVIHTSLLKEVSVRNVWFLPVPDRPLSCNIYYIIKADGRRRGEAYTCSRTLSDEQMCCCPISRKDPETATFDPRNRYQQIEIKPYPSGGFFATPIESDGCPPSFLIKIGWEVRASRPLAPHVIEAPGLHRPTNRMRVPFSQLDIPLQSKRSTPVVLGRWYCPFLFIKEENLDVSDQMRKSFVYELSLKLWWERFYYVNENDGKQGNKVAVDARVKRLQCFVMGMEAEKEELRDESDGFIWFKVKDGRDRVGLNTALIEKLRRVQEMRGWFDLNAMNEARVCGNKEIDNGGVEWKKFGCYVLVESFVLRRMDGSFLISFNFKNIEKIECKWE